MYTKVPWDGLPITWVFEIPDAGATKDKCFQVRELRIIAGSWQARLYEMDMGHMHYNDIRVSKTSLRDRQDK